MKRWFSNRGQKGGKPGDILAKLPRMPDMPKNIPLKIPANIHVKTITEFLQRIIKEVKAGAPPTGPARPMKYPYTFTAKVAQFPYKYYYNNNWIIRWYPVGIAACLPLFWYFGRMANTEQNKKQWKEIRSREKEQARHKFDY